jgi:heptosyltransferase II
MNKDSPTIFLVKYRALGDSIMGLSTLNYFRSIYPNSKIYYGVRDWTAKLYEDVDTDADEIIPISLNGFKDYLSLWNKLKALNIDIIHEMHVSGRTKKFFNLYSMLTSSKYTYHDHHLEKGGAVIDQGVKKELIQRDLDGVYSFYSRDQIVPNFKDFVPQLKNIKEDKDRSIIFGVVATRETKMWPLEQYINLAEKIKENFPDVTIKVPLSKSEQDKQIMSKLISLDIKKSITIIHEDLEKLPRLMAKSSLYVGNDTGLKHLAIACGVKSYTLFGPEPPREWHPYDSLKNPYFYIDNLECRTRDAHYCGLSTCSTMICLKNIEVDHVYETISKDLM